MIRQRMTYANVVSSLALFVALGGGAYAATQVEKNSVGSAQLQPNAVNVRHLSKPLSAKLARAVGEPFAPPRSNNPCLLTNPTGFPSGGCVNAPGTAKTFAALATKSWLLSCPPGRYWDGYPYPFVSVGTSAPHYSGESTADGSQIIFTLTNWSQGKQQFTPYIPCETT